MGTIFLICALTRLRIEPTTSQSEGGLATTRAVRWLELQPGNKQAHPTRDEGGRYNRQIQPMMSWFPFQEWLPCHHCLFPVISMTPSEAQCEGAGQWSVVYRNISIVYSNILGLLTAQWTRQMSAVETILTYPYFRHTQLCIHRDVNILTVVPSVGANQL